MDIKEQTSRNLLFSPYPASMAEVWPQLNRDFATAINQNRGLIFVSISRIALSMMEAQFVSHSNQIGGRSAPIFDMTWFR